MTTMKVRDASLSVEVVGQGPLADFLAPASVQATTSAPDTTGMSAAPARA